MYNQKLDPFKDETTQAHIIIRRRSRRKKSKGSNPTNPIQRKYHPQPLTQLALRIDQPTATTHHSKDKKSDAANSSAVFCLQRKV
jgi:hypothetical protein